MARAIPTYQRQNLAQGIQSAPNASSNVSASDPMAAAIGNLAQVAGAASNTLADEATRNANDLRQQTEKAALEAKRSAENAAAVDVANVLSQGDPFWQEKTTRMMQAWKVGDPDMRETIGTDFDKWVAESTAKLPTDASKKYFQQHAASMKARLQTNAFTFQEKSTTAKLNADSDAGQQADENTVYNDPTRFDEVFKRRVDPLLARSDLSEADKIKAADLYKRKLSLAVERGEMQRDPVGWYARRFGPAAPAAAVAPISRTEANGVVVTPVRSGSVQGADLGTLPMAGDPNLPAGMRNNNPGNIKYVGQAGTTPSVNKDQGDPQAVYASADEGMAAMFTLALKKYDGGKTTANSLIAGQNGWTPGNTAAAANVARAMGLSPDDNLNLRDPAKLKEFARALMQQEHGKASRAYGDDMVARIADDVLAGRKVQPGPSPAAPSAAAPSGGAPVTRTAVLDTAPATFRSMDWEQQDAMRSMVETRIKQSEAVYKAQFDSVIRNAIDMHKDGIQDPQPIPVETFDRFYGAEGPRMYAEYQKSRLMGADISGFKTQSEAEIMATLERLQPVPGPGYAADDERQRVRVQAAQAELKKRNDDPAGYATRNSESLKGQQAALAVPTLSGDERARLMQKFTRENLAEQQRLGIAIPQVLTPRQADAIASRAMNATRPEDSANLMRGLKAEYGEFFPQVFGQLVKENKLPDEMIIIANLDSPVAQEAVSRLSRIKEADLTKGLEATDVKIVKEKVVETLAEFARTMPLMTDGSARSINAYETTLRKLAYEFIQTGASADNAAKKAKNLILGKYEFDGTMRFPISVNKAEVMQSADRVLRFDLDNIDVVSDNTGVRTDAQKKAEWLSIVRERPQWFPRENDKGEQNDDGMDLWAMGKDGVRYRVTRGGKGVSYTWEELAAVKRAAELDPASRGSGARERMRINREASRQRIEETRRQVEAEDGVQP
jgi:hypothetical protein